jgi:hypothetical protein
MTGQADHSEIADRKLLIKDKIDGNVEEPGVKMIGVNQRGQADN